jgi:hypothetical protein
MRVLHCAANFFGGEGHACGHPQGTPASSCARPERKREAERCKQHRKWDLLDRIGLNSRFSDDWIVNVTEFKAHEAPARNKHTVGLSEGLGFVGDVSYSERYRVNVHRIVFKWQLLC